MVVLVLLYMFTRKLPTAPSFLLLPVKLVACTDCTRVQYQYQAGTAGWGSGVMFYGLTESHAPRNPGTAVGIPAAVLQ